MKNKLKIYLVLFAVTIYSCSTDKLISSDNDDQRVSNVMSDSFYNVITIKKDKMTFGVSETKPVDSDFYTNSNFFSNDGPIGLVVVRGEKLNNRSVGGGYFYIKNGKAYVSAKRCPKRVEYASQTILWAIDNGVINEYLLTQNHSKLKRYRTILGEDANGNIVMISSKRLGLVTIKEIIDFAVSKGVTEAILLDGGTSVDYKLTDGDENVSFESVPERLKPLFEIKKPTTYIYGNFN
jgi:hypothetical protein